MTAICSGGTSVSKPGFNSTVVITAAAVEGALALLGLEVVAAILAPIIAPTVLDLTTFCATDPPADPVLTGADILAATNFTDPISALNAQQRIRQWFESNYWYSVCQCTSVATPTTPTLSNPGPVSTNPGLPSGQLGPNCWQKSGVVTYVVNGQDLQWQPDLFPTGDLLSIWNGNQKPVALQTPLPTSITYTATMQPFSGGATNFQPSLVFYAANGSPVGGSPFNGPVTAAGSQASVSHAVPSVAVFVTAGVISGGTFQAVGQQATGEVTIYCGSQSPSQPVSPCCPPDPILEYKLDQILGMLTSVFQSLPSPLTSYAEGDVHTGLSGHGTVTLATPGAIAVKAVITTLPSYLGELAGTPVTVFDAGFITPVTTEGPVGAQRLTWTTQVFLLPQLSSAVDYTLPGGLVLELTELTAGP